MPDEQIKHTATNLASVAFSDSLFPPLLYSPAKKQTLYCLKNA